MSTKQESLDIIRQNVSDILTSDGWKRALAFRKTFHNYSFFNALLIYSQRPEATLVAGYRAWQKHGRQVQKGEKGIKILGPVLKKDEESGERKLVGFRQVSVFDVGQTEGDPVPLGPRPELLEDDTPAIRAAFERLVAFLRDEVGVPVRDEDLPPGVMGCYYPSEKRIALRTDLPPLQRLKTGVHEAVHCLLDHRAAADAQDRHLRELEAETGAYLALDELGLDVGAYSFAYLAHHTGDLDELMTAGERASSVAGHLAAAVAPSEEVAEPPASESAVPVAA